MGLEAKGTRRRRGAAIEALRLHPVRGAARRSFLLGWDRGFVGQVATLTPGAGVTASATLDPASSDVDAVTVGGGASWVAYDSGPSNGSVFTTYLARYGPGLGTVATAPLPGVQAVNGLAVGGGSVWVNDGIDGKLYQVDPASIS